MPAITTSFQPWIAIRKKGMNEKVKCNVIGRLDNYSALDLGNRVYATSGIDPACTAHAADTLGKILVKQATKEGFIEMEEGGIFDGSFPESETRRGRVQEGGTISPTITAQNQELYRIESQYRIRKLTPLECFRLMGVTDENAKKMLSVNSNSQCYKQAGNSIVVDVMAAMFSKLF